MKRKPSVRVIALIAECAGAKRFTGSNGAEARGWAVFVGEQLAERYKRPASRVFACLMLLFGYVKPVPFCRCERCQPLKTRVRW